MMRAAPHLALAGLFALLAACTTTAEPGAPDRPAALPQGSCDAGPVQDMLGEHATRALGTELLRRTGARTLRWGPPGAMFTMDYRQDRLNVSYDEDMAVTRISCG